VPLRLPPLSGVRLFEAAGRHLSFKRAAEELLLTPSAVSHGIQGLEDWIGTPLFVRRRNGLGLTPEGAAFHAAVHEALVRIATATEALPGQSHEIRISVAPTFGARLLLPLLGRFRARHPDISVIIDTSHRQVSFPGDGADVAIRLGTGEWDGLSSELLLPERLMPVSTPELKERWSDCDDLNRIPLIHVTSVSQDWQAWADATGSGRVDVTRGLRVDTLQMALEAAVAGLGVAVGRLPLCDQELASGSLVPFRERVVPSTAGYWLVGLPGTMSRSDLRAFRNWLVRELAGGAASPTAVDQPATERAPLDGP
jgi:LysR family transcriptional regulator, glycine cleavage system transcriptional activator